jgi:hypothetical protein
LDHSRHVRKPSDLRRGEAELAEEPFQVCSAEHLLHAGA